MSINEGGLSNGGPKAPDILEGGLRWIVRLGFSTGNDDTPGLNERELVSASILGQGEPSE